MALTFTLPAKTGCELTKNSMYSKISSQVINQEPNHLVPLTHELMKLNSMWQRTINDEKERRRHIYMNDENSNITVERNEMEDEGLYMKTAENSCTQNNSITSANLALIQPVSTIIVTNGLYQDQIAIEFTLNKNQKAAFMIITSHLNGISNPTGKKKILLFQKLQVFFR